MGGPKGHYSPIATRAVRFYVSHPATDGRWPSNRFRQSRADAGPAQVTSPTTPLRSGHQADLHFRSVGCTVGLRFRREYGDALGRIQWVHSSLDLRGMRRIQRGAFAVYDHSKAKPKASSFSSSSRRSRLLRNLPCLSKLKSPSSRAKESASSRRPRVAR
jgi:hypothetical protein